VPRAPVYYVVLLTFIDIPGSQLRAGKVHALIAHAGLARCPAEAVCPAHPASHESHDETREAPTGTASAPGGGPSSFFVVAVLQVRMIQRPPFPPQHPRATARTYYYSNAQHTPGQAESGLPHVSCRNSFACH
jgi:hypothetical protein